MTIDHCRQIFNITYQKQRMLKIGAMPLWHSDKEINYYTADCSTNKRSFCIKFKIKKLLVGTSNFLINNRYIQYSLIYD